MYNQRFIVEFLDPGPDPDFAAPVAVVVLRNINQPAGQEVGIYFKILPFQDADRGVDQLDEIMGQDFGSKAHGNAFHTLCQQQREFDRQGHRLFVPTVVGELPWRRFRVKHHFEGKLRKPCLDVSGCR